jgi:hypothetical protein
LADPIPIHRHPVGQVQQDSGLSRAALYKRIDQAGVKPLRVGQNSFQEWKYQEAPEELVAVTISHLDGLLSYMMKAARKSRELPASRVQLLVVAEPRGATFSRYGLSFRPTGKQGQETSWRVVR